MLEIIVEGSCVIFIYINLSSAASLLSVINYLMILNQMKVYTQPFSLDIIGHFNGVEWQ